MVSTRSRALCWIRRDLRTYDHAALAAATAAFEETAVVFVFDRAILDTLQDRDDRRVTFIHRSLREVDGVLRVHGSRLVVLQGDPVELIPRLARDLGAGAVFFGRDYEPYARTRDSHVAASLTQLGIEAGTERDHVGLEPDEVLTKDGRPFQVYTPYSRAWRERFRHGDAVEHTPDLGRLVSVERLSEWNSPWDLEDIGFREASLTIDAGQEAGRRRLRQFAERIGDYEAHRDFPAEDGTSLLSPHLRFGTVSIRDCIRSALSHGAAGEKWLSELIWRDFFQHVLWHFPYVAEKPFRHEFDRLEWPGSPDHFLLWCHGRTGYPIVDAAMRCLNDTGLMPNRLRMVAASFLSKDLLIDYRKGEEHFARKLLDFDLASNNGNWQWAASTGVDAQPAFRIFNPLLQSRRFDPKGTFIRRWLPELAELDDVAIHSPATATEGALAMAGVRLGETYPAPIVDHATQRERALAFLGSATKNTVDAGSRVK